MARPKKCDPATDPVNAKHDIGATIELGRVMPEDCLHIYKILGVHRSMPKIQKYLKNQGRKPPALQTIKQWSVTHKWAYWIDCYERECALEAENKAKAAYGEEASKDIGTLAAYFRETSRKLIRKVNNKIEHLKLQDGTQIRAAVEAAVGLSKAAEVMDGGVSDRTEGRQVLTIDERRSKAQEIVDMAFQKNGFGGQDNGNKPGRPVGIVQPGAEETQEQPVDHAADARTGTDGL